MLIYQDILIRIVLPYPGYTAHASGTITTYDSSDTVLNTYTFTNQTTITHTYVDSFDHYVVNYTVFETGDTVNETYTESTNTSHEFTLSEMSFIVLNFSHDGETVTNEQTIRNWIQNNVVTFKEYDTDDVEYIRDASYIVTIWNDQPAVMCKWTWGNYLRVDVEGTGYDSSHSAYRYESIGSSSTVSVNTVSPEITFNIILEDIDGNLIPHSAIDEITEYLSTSHLYTLKSGVNDNLILEIKVKVSQVGTGVTFTYDSHQAGSITFCVATREQLMEYTEDTTVTKTMVIPVTTDSNSVVVSLYAATADGIYLCSMANQIYTYATDGTNTYTPVLAQSIDTTQPDVGYYMVKVPGGTEITFVGGDFTYNEVVYHALDLASTFGNGNYGAYSIGSGNIMIKDTSSFSSVVVAEYAGASSPISITGQYKIEVYRNSQLAESTTTFGPYYTCPISVYVGDAVEARFYRNDGTENSPQWSSRYAVRTFSITQPYMTIDFGDIYLEEIDAEINNESYTNKHAYEIHYTRVINPTVTTISSGTLLLENVRVDNRYNTDITAYMNTVSVGFVDSSTGTFTDYQATWDTSNGEITYTDTRDLPTGEYMIELHATDLYGILITSNLTVIVTGNE